MERYSLIETKMPREFVLLQGRGCKWAKCTFCDYHSDKHPEPFEQNRLVLEKVRGVYGVLDVINSGSAVDLDSQTIDLINKVVKEKNIHTLWFEMHYMYRKQLLDFAKLFPNVKVKFRCGIETFDADLREKWNKGVAKDVTAEDVARYFQGVCLLCCTKGETKERIQRDIDLALKYFEYFSVNLFCNNTTQVERDEELAQWFEKEIYPQIKDNPKVEILLNNLDLGVG
jgi:hypothetical protein